MTQRSALVLCTPTLYARITQVSQPESTSVEAVDLWISKQRATNALQVAHDERSCGVEVREVLKGNRRRLVVRHAVVVCMLPILAIQ